MVARGTTLAVARRALRAHRDRLLAIPGVLFLAVGRKVTGGTRTPLLSIRVFVRRKYAARGRRRIPVQIRAIAPGGIPLPFFVPTDVEESPGPARALAFQGGTAIVGRMRGSIGLVYRSVSGSELFLTNAHVVAGTDARSIGRVIRSDDEENPEPLGVVHRTVRVRSSPEIVNRVDASLVEPTAPVDLYTVSGIPVAGERPLGIAEERGYLYVGRGVRKECEGPEEVLTPVPVQYGTKLVLFRDFVRLTLSKESVASGDSGSLLMRETPEGIFACGLVFAGRDRTVYAIRLRDALVELGKPGASEDSTEEDVAIDWD